MSGFFGIFRPQGGSVDLEAFEQMRKAIEREGFDGLETHVEEKIAMGHLMLRVSPEAKYDQQPLHSECGRYLLVGHFRLDYRDELGDKLELTQSELDQTPDSQLVMLAYQKWKDQSVHHIEGDWAFALFDKIENAFFLAKDKFGHSALFFSKYQDAIYFSSDVTVFDKIISFHKEIDYKQLTRLSIPGLEMELGKTLLIGLEYLPTSNFINYSSSLKRAQLKYWELNTGDTFFYHNIEDQIEELRSILLSSIVSRIRTREKIGLFLSSGLDSTTIAHYISEFMSFTKDSFNSYTSVPAFLESYPKEQHKKISEEFGVNEFIAGKKNINQKFLDFSEVSISELLFSDWTSNYFYPIVSMNRFWLNGILSEAKSDGVRRVLSGQLGNYVITWTGYNHFFWMFLKFRLCLLYKEIKIASLANSINFFKIFNREIIKSFHRQISTFIKTRSFFLSKYLFQFSIFIPQKANTLLLNSEMNKGLLVPGLHYESCPGQFRQEILLKGSLQVGMRSFSDSHLLALESSDPTSDTRLIEYTFSINQSLFYKEGQKKFIFKKMMGNILPHHIINQKGIFPQSFDIPIRINEDLRLNQKIKQILLNDSLKNQFRISFIQELYNQIQTDKKNRVQVAFSNTLLRCLSIICFFEKKS